MFTYKYKSKKEFNADKNRTSPYVCLIEDTGEVLSDYGASELDELDQPADWESALGAMTIGGAKTVTKDLYENAIQRSPLDTESAHVFPDLQYYTSLGFWPSTIKFKKVILPPVDYPRGKVTLVDGGEATVIHTDDLSFMSWPPDHYAGGFIAEGKATIIFLQTTPPAGISNRSFTGGDITIRVHEEALAAYKAELSGMTIETIEGAEEIEFKDPCAKGYCNNSLNVFTKGEAAKITDITGITYNSDWGDVYLVGPNGIQSFDELKYFTGITAIGGLQLSNSPIKSITIPVNVTAVDSGFLGNKQSCYDVVRAVKMTMLPNTPPQIENVGTTANPIRCMDVKTSVVYVPNESLSLYKADENWGKYNIKPIEND